MSLAAFEVLRQGRMAMRRQVDIHRRRSAQLEALHKMHAQVPAGNGAPGFAGAVHLGTAVSAVDCFGSVMAAEDRTTRKKAVVKVDQVRLCVVRLLGRGSGGAQIQQYVLGVWEETEALTWEGMGSLAVQTGWD